MIKMSVCCVVFTSLHVATCRYMSLQPIVDVHMMDDVLTPPVRLGSTAMTLRTNK